MRKRLVAMLALVATAAVVAACGDDNGDGNGGVEAGGVAVDLTDFQFSPDEMEGTAGETVSIQLENTGSTSHTFTGDDVDEEISPGDSATVEVTLPDTGSFDFFCRFHQGEGMEGSITTGGAPAGDTPATDPPATSAPSGGGTPGY